MSFLKNNFLLTNKTAEKLYTTYASKAPIFDYCSYLSSHDILLNNEFKDIYQIWLAADHYKWKLMRNYGIKEEYITGSRTPKEKFVAYCSALGAAFSHPLYLLSQLELKTYFKCDLEINEQNAEKIWDHCNNYIRDNHLSPQKIIESSKVTHVFINTDIFEDLSTFDKINKKDYKFKVFPIFNIDKIVNIESEKYIDVLSKLGSVKNLDELQNIIEKRLVDFTKCGCVSSSISLEKIESIQDYKKAAKAFANKRKGKKLSDKEVVDFKGYLTYFLLKLFAKYNIRSQLHIGIKRNSNNLMLTKLGEDAGFDSLTNENNATNLLALINRLNNEKSLPSMIVLDAHKETMSLVSCFQDPSIKGKIQCAWEWGLLDSKAEIEKYLCNLSSVNHIASSIGVASDAYSWLSFYRHQYFRRILCSYLGKLIEQGEITSDIEFVGKVISDICYNTAMKYFGM